MTIQFYQTLHVLSVLVLTAYTFFAFAGPAPETKKRVMIITGSAALLMIVSGFGMLGKMGVGFPWWAIVKLVCLIGVSALSGIAYRRPAARGMLSAIAIVLLTVAVYTVYHK